MRRTEILRQVTIILIAVVCLGVAGIRSYEIYKAEKVTENVESVTYNGHKYLYFKNVKCLVHDEACNNVSHNTVSDDDWDEDEDD